VLEISCRSDPCWAWHNFLFDEYIYIILPACKWVLLQIRPGNSPHAVHHEQYICGDEKTVGARMVQNVFQAVIAVGKELGYGIEWGDGKASREGIADNSVVPDFVALQHGQDLRVVGEAKTPWALDIATAAEHVLDDNTLRNWLGKHLDGPQPFSPTDTCFWMI
jgi:hypothetical protein